jgi:UDP-glucose 4-epimerase
MKVFITGGLGFLGQSIMRVFEHHSVTIFDLNMENFRRNCEEFKTASFIKGDILDQNALSTAMANHDVVIHLATYMNPTPSIENYKKSACVGIIGTLEVIKAMKKNNINNLVFLSSSFVYGNTPENKEGNKEESSKNPHTGYGVAKLTAEHFIKHSGVNYVIFRPSIVCGRYDWYGQSISIFIKQALELGQIKMYRGDENISRDYVYSDDVARCILYCVDNGAFDNNIYNLSSHQQITTIELANKISQRIPGVKLVFVDKPADNRNTPLEILHLDNSKICKFFPMKRLDEYLDDYIIWAREHYQLYW